MVPRDGYGCPAERSDIHIYFSVNMDIRVRIQSKQDVKWMYLYSFLKTFLYPIPRPYSKNSEISDIIHIHEVQVILKPSKIYNYD